MNLPLREFRDQLLEEGSREGTEADISVKDRLSYYGPAGIPLFKMGKYFKITRALYARVVCI